MCRPSKIDVAMCRPSEMDVSKIDESTFGDGCVEKASKTDDRCVDLRRSVIDVSTIEDR